MKWTGLSMKWTRFPNHIDTQQQKCKRVWLNASPSLNHHTSGEKGLAAIITFVAKSFSLEVSLEAVPSSSPIPEISAQLPPHLLLSVQDLVLRRKKGFVFLIYKSKEIITHGRSPNN
ncbi:hypothetical protein L2E82_27754 [Cichorium intybus]|uniref:Uncharacterized protein n=1 Tax=Cichorium intybus TaxID=13427 RepID=A0ACB9CUH4_CICIN|nr:hypothetical protein L2E82_27754 [Cichorium intybus]